ncbi:hypothetical protein LCGC14_0400570 [marine sediment metagenome]|uniref:Uncharacterized protein n=1 Tax=marine sediment metagenome TaxID=412755 RepID=A0A0F9TF58_9ZZZZ
MANQTIENLVFTKTTYPDVLEVANKLAELEQRKPHDSIRLLILEAGNKKITQLDSESQEKTLT